MRWILKPEMQRGPPIQRQLHASGKSLIHGDKQFFGICHATNGQRGRWPSM
jgi:hypothetical protein